jgi:hypothetical protein
MFPNPHHPPPLPAQYPVDQPVAALVGIEFPPPEGGILPRLITVPPAPMPETPVHKHRDVLTAKHKVGFAKHWLIPSPASNPVASQEFRQRQLRPLVPPPANPRHHFGTLPLGENVNHGYNG